MYDFDRPRNAPREGDVRIPAGCAIAAIMDRSGARHDGSDILRSIALMHDRSNGLGGGFAAYGIYPEYEELFAFHIMYESDEARRETEAYLDTYFMSEKQGGCKEIIPRPDHRTQIFLHQIGMLTHRFTERTKNNQEDL